MAVPLDLTPLINAIGRLRDGLVRHRQNPDDEQLRDGMILRFEYTYELCHRFLRRYLWTTAASPGEIERTAFQELIRFANQLGLLRGEWPDWHRYRDLRARTSHTYQAETAEQVAAAIPGFLAEAEYLRDQLRTRLS